MLDCIDLSAADLEHERDPGDAESVHFPEHLARTIVDTFSTEGDVVLDPFAGYGTTLLASQRAGRHAIGIELLPQRADIIRRRLGPSVRVITGDARRIKNMSVGPLDLCFTSPPYMTATEHPENPLTAYRSLDGDYEAYLNELTAVFAAVAQQLRPSGHLVINAANIRTKDTVTTLAWDIARRTAEHVPFLGEIYLRWDTAPDVHRRLLPRLPKAVTASS